MNLKDKIPAKNSKFNISNKFLRPDRVSYIVDYPNILANENTITKGTTYAFFNCRDNKITMNLVNITDAYYDGYVLSLILKDVESKGAGINVEFDIFKPPTECTWLLVDLAFLQEKVASQHWFSTDSQNVSLINHRKSFKTEVNTTI